MISAVQDRELTQAERDKIKDSLGRDLTEAQALELLHLCLTPDADLESIIERAQARA